MLTNNVQEDTGIDTEIDIDIHTKRQTHRQTDRQTDRQRESYSVYREEHTHKHPRARVHLYKETA